MARGILVETLQKSVVFLQTLNHKGDFTSVKKIILLR